MTSDGAYSQEFQQAILMSTNHSATTEERAIYRSMLTATWVSAISAVIAVLIAAFGLYALWQTHQLLLESHQVENHQGEEIHAIDTSPTEILERLNLAQSEAVTATTELTWPSAPRLLVLDHGELSTTNDNSLQVDPSQGTLLNTSSISQGLFAVIDGHIVPIELPLEILSGNTEVVYIKLISPHPNAESDEDFRLESADHLNLTNTANFSPTQELDLYDTSVDEGQGQNFGISFETTKGTKTITIVTWYNY
jgi:hypothetical protein